MRALLTWTRVQDKLTKHHYPLIEKHKFLLVRVVDRDIILDIPMIYRVCCVLYYLYLHFWIWSPYKPKQFTSDKSLNITFALLDPLQYMFVLDESDNPLDMCRLLFSSDTENANKTRYWFDIWIHLSWKEISVDSMWNNIHMSLVGIAYG